MQGFEVCEQGTNCRRQRDRRQSLTRSRDTWLLQSLPGNYCCRYGAGECQEQGGLSPSGSGPTVENVSHRHIGGVPTTNSVLCQARLL